MIALSERCLVDAFTMVALRRQGLDPLWDPVAGVRVSGTGPVAERARELASLLERSLLHVAFGEPAPPGLDSTVMRAIGVFLDREHREIVGLAARLSILRQELATQAAQA